MMKLLRLIIMMTSLLTLASCAHMHKGGDCCETKSSCSKETCKDDSCNKTAKCEHDCKENCKEACCSEGKCHKTVKCEHDCEENCKEECCADGNCHKTA